MTVRDEFDELVLKYLILKLYAEIYGITECPLEQKQKLSGRNTDNGDGKLEQIRSSSEHSGDNW